MLDNMHICMHTFHGPHHTDYLFLVTDFLLKIVLQTLCADKFCAATVCKYEPQIFFQQSQAVAECLMAAVTQREGSRAAVSRSPSSARPEGEGRQLEEIRYLGAAGRKGKANNSSRLPKSYSAIYTLGIAIKTT